jgi:hypothetical protein
MDRQICRRIAVGGQFFNAKVRLGGKALAYRRYRPEPGAGAG